MSDDGGWIAPGHSRFAPEPDRYDLRAVRGYEALITRSTSVERHFGQAVCPEELCSAIDSVFANRSSQERQRYS
jgi:hypothetical protein